MNAISFEQWDKALKEHNWPIIDAYLDQERSRWAPFQRANPPRSPVLAQTAVPARTPERPTYDEIEDDDGSEHDADQVTNRGNIDWDIKEHNARVDRFNRLLDKGKPRDRQVFSLRSAHH